MGQQVVPLSSAMWWCGWRKDALLPLSLATCSKRETRPNPLPAAALWRMSSAPCLGSMAELILQTWMWMSQPWGRERSIHSWYHLPRLQCGGSGEGKMPSCLAPTTSNWPESWPSPLPAAIPWKEGLASHLGSPVEPTLLTVSQVSRPQEQDHGRSACAPHLPYDSVSGQRWPPTLPLNAWGSWENWPCGHESGRAAPFSYYLQHLGEQTLHLSWAAQ